ncbi:uncharacterized protein ARMOST_03995 [Armillaria ostoyae]|uniref:Protein kinase domain-containing protein n=1 Tax=Armillaria ostoyae TaxID=47428 RepID=A0A284QW64_ARMOS|nr:uncharacterized protein ARMOST_03995 [Armillaria ostoyae]
MSGIGGQRSGADSGEAPAESPARSPDSQKQMATVKLMCAIAPASVATRPSTIPSSTPKDSGIFLLWTKPAVDDKLTPLGRRTSQASPLGVPRHGSQAADVWSWSTAHSLASPSASSTTQVSDPRRSAGEQQGEPAWRQWAKEARKREETKKKEEETKRKEEEMQPPWRSVELISPSAEIMVMDVLQQELDVLSCPDEYRPTCMKCLQVLSRTRNTVPSSFSCRDVTREGTYPVWGGGFSDIWKGRLHDTQVCLKVLRIFISGEARKKVVRDFCQEALVWRQLQCPPFLGSQRGPSYCLISPWMINGNIISYLEAHPDHDRLMSLVQIAEGMKYLHNLDPPIVHADIRGANNLVTDDLCCCLADFGLSLLAESQGLDSSSRMRKGGIRWLAPEYILPTLFDPSYVAARDICLRVYCH